MTSFDNVAEIYDATRGMPPEIAAEVTAGLLSVVTPRKDTRFLEIGIGTGRIGLPIAQQGYDYTGIDLSPGMLAELAAKSDGQVSAVRGDATGLPFATNSFDVALSCHVLHLVPDWRAALGEIRRVLRSGGLYLHCEGSGARWDTPVYKAWQSIAERHDVELRKRQGADAAAILAYLRDASAKISVHSLAHWRSETRVDEAVRHIAERTFSNCWSIPDELFGPMVAELRDWVGGQTELGEVLQQDHSFTATCARL